MLAGCGRSTTTGCRPRRLRAGGQRPQDTGQRTAGQCTTGQARRSTRCSSSGSGSVIDHQTSHRGSTPAGCGSSATAGCRPPRLRAGGHCRQTAGQCTTGQARRSTRCSSSGSVSVIDHQASHRQHAGQPQQLSHHRVPAAPPSSWWAVLATHRPTHCRAGLQQHHAQQFRAAGYSSSEKMLGLM